MGEGWRRMGEKIREKIKNESGLDMFLGDANDLPLFGLLIS